MKISVARGHTIFCHTLMHLMKTQNYITTYKHSFLVTNIHTTNSHIDTNIHKCIEPHRKVCWNQNFITEKLIQPLNMQRILHYFSFFSLIIKGNEPCRFIYIPNHLLLNDYMQYKCLRMVDTHIYKSSYRYMR